MIHAVCYPAADPERAKVCALKWRNKGYEPFIMLDRGVVLDPNLRDHDPSYGTVMEAPDPFPGYYRVINSIVAAAFKAGADLVTCIGDDMDQPEQDAQQVADIYFNRFPDGFGVMQGIGDTKGEIKKDPVTGTMQHNAGRVCGSPTFGRRWNDRAYGGKGPFCEEYAPFYGDEDLQNVAHMCGVLYQEPIINIKHNHWAFGLAPKMWWHEKAQKQWTEMYKIFVVRKSQGFPGHEPLPQKAVSPK